MENETDSHDLIVTGDSGLTRWAPLIVVLGVVCGFVMLSWYAYHAGIQSVKEEDLVVVEADKTPIKEKPADPGGMQFPNQDKTVFETFSGNAHQPAKVERVLPVPEEPMPKDADASDTTTWINKELPKKGAAEQVIGKELAKKGDEHSRMPSSLSAMDEKTVYTSEDKSPRQPADHQIIAAQADDEQSTTYVASKNSLTSAKSPDKSVVVADNKKGPFAPEKPVSGATDSEDNEVSEMPVQKAVDAEMKPAKPQPIKVAKEVPHDVVPVKTVKTTQGKAASISAHASVGNAVVQLGAYRSQEEADAAWEKMHLKQKLLSDKKPTVLKVNLGEKGIYYRLRVGGIASPGDAKSFCHALTANGQPCIIPTEK